MRGLRRSGPLVASWFELLPPNQQPTARALHKVIMAEAPQFDLAVRSGNLAYALAGRFALVLAPHRTHIHLQLMRWEALAASFPELDASARGQWRVRLGQPVDEALVRRLVQAVIGDLQAMPPEGAPR